MPALHAHADLETLRGEDVGLRAVHVVEERDAAGAVRVVLDGDDLGLDAVLHALEVDDAVLVLVAAATVAGGLAAVRVAAATGRLRGEQALLRGRLGDVAEVGHRLETATGTGRLALADCHGVLSFRTAGSCFPLRG